MSEKPSDIAALDGPVLEGCDGQVLAARTEFIRLLETGGLSVTSLSITGTEKAEEFFAPMQAHEAWRTHRTTLDEHRSDYSPAVASRLEWGRGISAQQFDQLNGEHRSIVAAWEQSFSRHPLLLLPAVPFAELKAGEDQSANRPRILKLTTPASLGRWPVLTVPWRPDGSSTGIGFQIMAPRGGEARLVGFAEWLSQNTSGC